MSNCTIIGQSDTVPTEADADLIRLQHAVNHMLHDIALAIQLHRVVEPSVRTCPLDA